MGTVFSVSLGKYLSSLDGCQRCLQPQHERRRQEDSTLRASLDFKVIASLKKERKKSSFWLFHIYKKSWGVQTSPRASSLVALFPISKPQPLVSGPQKIWCCNRTHGFRIHSPFSHFASHFFLPFPDKTSFSFTFPPAIRWRICNGWELRLPLTNVFVNNNNNIKRMHSKCLPET